jgi:hypothetical protein
LGIAFAGLATAVFSSSAYAKDEPDFGPAVDAFCTAQGRTPATPFANLKSVIPTTECQLCHKPFTFDKVNVTQGFYEWKLARKIANDTATPPDFSWFCPAAPSVNNPPVLDPIGNQAVNEGEQLVFAVSASDSDGDALSFQAADLPTGAAFEDRGDGGFEFTWTPGFDQTGDYPVTFIVTDDGVPMRSDSETIRITVGNVNRAPTLDPIGNRSILPGDVLSIMVTATDPDTGDLLRFEAMGLPSGAQLIDRGTRSAQISWTPSFDQAGNYPVLVRVTDDGFPMESDSEQITLSVGNVNRPPTLDPVGNRTGRENEPLVIALTGRDPDGDRLSFGTTELPQGAQLVDHGNGSAEIDWTPIVGQAGNYPLTISLSDDRSPPESDSEAITLRVAPADLPPANRPPNLDPVGNRSVRVGQRLAIVLTASDPDGNSGLRFGADGLPASASFVDYGDSSAEVSWTPGPADVGDHAVTFSVTDSATPPDSDSEAIVIRVEPPVVTPPPSGAATLHRARWKANTSRLEVRGRADANATLEILSADSGEVLGQTMADLKGKLVLNTRPYVVPCAVQGRTGSSYTEVVPVENAPAECGRSGFTYFRITSAEWKCERSELRVKGDRAPAYATIAVYSEGQLLGTAVAHPKGKFDYRGSLVTEPYEVQLGVVVGEETWLTTAPTVVYHSQECEAYESPGAGK